MADFTAFLEEFRSLTLARQRFPMWTDWGVEDTSVAVHSLGLSYLLTIGQALRHAACCEYPVDPTVRADCIWWDKATRQQIAVFEFERHKDGDELRGKVKNLLLAYHRFGHLPELLGLVFWTKYFYPLDTATTDGLWALFQSGFRSNEGVMIQGAESSRLRIFEVLHRSSADGRLLLKQISERKRR